MHPSTAANWNACAEATHLWCRDDQPEGQEGLTIDIIPRVNTHCLGVLARCRYRWDGLGHLDMAAVMRGDYCNFAEDVVDESSAESSSCFRLEAMGRFLHGPCESSSSSSSSCSSSFCQTWELGEQDDAEDEVQDLGLCFDELGHLVAVYVCGILRWHQNKWFPGGIPEDADDVAIELLPEGAEEDPPSWAETEGVAIELFLPADESSSSSSSSSCENVYNKRCQPVPAFAVVAVFDSLGHLTWVSNPSPVSLLCGVLTECCEDGGSMPKQFLTVWEITVPGATGVWWQCAVATWEGCAWGGHIDLPCCTDSGSLNIIENVPFAIACTAIGFPPEFPDSWHLCLANVAVATTGLFPVRCCPVDGEKTGGFNMPPGCRDIAFTLRMMDIPCVIDCEASTLECPSISSSNPVSDQPSDGGPSSGSGGGPDDP